MVFKDTFFSRNLSINCRGKLMDLSRPRVMGILNVTPDSFYDGGRYTDKDAIAGRVRQIVDEGADIIDIGAYSSRPGADDISAENGTLQVIACSCHRTRDIPRYSGIS